MDTALLWFDNSPKSTLEEKIRRAAEYYCKKYGRTPELCLINPEMAKSHPDIKEVAFGTRKIVVRPWRGTLSHHFWIGFEETPDAIARAQ